MPTAMMKIMKKKTDEGFWLNKVLWFSSLHSSVSGDRNSPGSQGSIRDKMVVA